MNLTELKKKPVPELVELSREMKIDGVGRSRKQDLIFAILKAHAKKEKISTVMEYSKFSRMDLVSYALRIALIWRGRMISMSRPVR